MRSENYNVRHKVLFLRFDISILELVMNFELKRKNSSLGPGSTKIEKIEKKMQRHLSMMTYDYCSGVLIILWLLP